MADSNNTQEHIPATCQYKALHDFVNGQTSLSEAQDSFCAPVEEKFSSAQDDEEVEGVLWTSWGAVIESAKAYGQNVKQRQKLVEFVLALQKRRTLEKDGQVCKVWEATVWSDLPVFGAELREGWNSPPDSATEHEKLSWLNLNAFTAALVASTHEQGGSLDLALYGIWTLRSGLEEDSPSTLDVQTAAAWLICATPTLAALSKAEKAFDGKLARPGQAFGDKEWRGYCDERWTSWVDRIDQIDHQAHGPLAAELLSKAKQKVQALAG